MYYGFILVFYLGADIVQSGGKGLAAVVSSAGAWVWLYKQQKPATSTDHLQFRIPQKALFVCDLSHSMQH